MMLLMMIILSALKARVGFENYLVPEQPRWSFSTIVENVFHSIAPQSMLDTYHQFAGCSLYSVPTAVALPCPLDNAACISTPAGDWDCEASAFVSVIQVPLHPEGQCINYNYTDDYSFEEVPLATTVYNPAVVELFFTLSGHADPVSSQTVILSNVVKPGPTNLLRHSPLDIQPEEYVRVYCIVVIFFLLLCCLVLLRGLTWRFLKHQSEPETPFIPLRQRQVDPDTSLRNFYMLKVRKVNALSHSRQRELRQSRVASTLHARRLKKLHTDAVADHTKLRKDFKRLNRKHALGSKKLGLMKQKNIQAKDEVEKLKNQNALLDHDCVELNVKLASTETSLEYTQYEKDDFEQRFKALETKIAELEPEFQAALEFNKALRKKDTWRDQQLERHKTCHTDVEFQKLRNSYVNSTSNAAYKALQDAYEVLQDAHKPCKTIFEIASLEKQVMAKEKLLIQQEAAHKEALLQVENECAILRSKEEDCLQRQIKLQNANGSDLMKLKAESDRANALEKVNQELRNQLESQKQQHAQEVLQIHSSQAQHLRATEESTNELKEIWEEERGVLKAAQEGLQAEYNDLFEQATGLLAQRDTALEKVANLKANASEPTSDGLSVIEEWHDVAATEATDFNPNATEPVPVLYDLSEPEEQHDAALSEVEDLEADHIQPATNNLDEAATHNVAPSTHGVALRANESDIDDILSRAPKGPKFERGVPTQPKGYHATFMSSDAKKKPTRRGGLGAAMKRRAVAATAAAAAPRTPRTTGPLNLLVNPPQSSSSSVPFNLTGQIAATTQVSAAASSFVLSPTTQISKAVGSTSNTTGGLNASKWAN